MAVAIVCEGRSDAAVITNILKGALGIDQSDIVYLVPELEYDETDLSQMRLEQFSNWTIVKKSCVEKEKISTFLNLFEDDRFVIIHLDTDMRFEIGYDVPNPKEVKTDVDMALLHDNVHDKIHEWLAASPSKKIVLAIAIQEIDAWVLTIYDKTTKETGTLNNAKKSLFKAVNDTFSKKEKTKIFSLEKDKFEQYKSLSSDFRKLKQLKAFAEKNKSLQLFIQSLLERTNH